jgi:DNA invertase Pin-like site-specific DNA recombinase
LLLPSKIQSRHLDRLAVVYVRQSSVQQVMEHRESTALQYALQSRASQWGWPSDRVVVIDRDQGQSAASAAGREGFQKLLAEVSLDHVGLILGIEMSRLARSCRDWHQLLELCALFGVLLADTDGLYDPRDYNDRLLLGLKGTLSEAELHVLRQRMHQGRLNKARRGELFNHPPLGYVRLGGDGALGLDPDQQVQGVVRLVFEKFDELGTINAVLRYLVKRQVLLPIRVVGGAQHGQLQWRAANRQTLRNLLRHPVYAGAYTWGRRPIDPRAQVPGRPGTGRKVAEPERCQVLIRDRCPAYITWEQYRINRDRLRQNQNRADTQGAAREGSALLGGLLVCGRCGRRMSVQYRPRDNNRVRYVCSRACSDYGQPLCQSVCGRTLDQLVGTLVLKVLEPAALELSLAAAQDLQREQQRLEHHWQQRLERAEYQCDRAARQYHAAEPENRLVARELEKRWEAALLEQRDVQEACDRFRREQPTMLSDEDRESLRCLAQDIPALWRSVHTTAAERKTVVRHLIERVVLTAPAQSELADVGVHWAGGFVSHHELTRPVARYEQLRDYPRLNRRIVELRGQKLTSKRIAEQLNAEGWHPPKRRATFNAGMVRSISSRRHRATARPVPYELKPGEWWFADLAHRLQLPHPTLYSWMRRGWVNARRLDLGPQGRWLLWADEDELDRLRRLRDCPRSWHSQRHAADLTRPKLRSAHSSDSSKL